ncbi:cholesterol oxidase substrate-binding domain-containing protein [Streptomyces sp. NPDC048514]|uniref:cholesterol oxidase substrate-binding domain-containing protein n=1 Tax=Streptomyces sp. NPDC048514 TaxID=3365564 RepID=UPI003714D205
MWRWSKGWACTEDAAWSDPEVLPAAVPGSFEAGVWEEAVATLNRLDPHRVSTNGFLDRLPSGPDPATGG